MARDKRPESRYDSSRGRAGDSRDYSQTPNRRSSGYREGSSQRRYSSDRDYSKMSYGSSYYSEKEGADSNRSKSKRAQRDRSQDRYSNANIRSTSNGSAQSDTRRRGELAVAADGPAGNVSAYSRRKAQEGYAAKRRKRARRKKAVLITLSIVVVLLLGSAVGAFAYVQNIQNKLSSNIDQATRDALVPVDATAPEDPFYALVLGVDMNTDRLTDGHGGNTSDSMILARIDPGNKQVTLVSLHRDTMVDLSAYGGGSQSKINSAFTLGGPELTIKQVSKLAGVDISHYVELDFDGFTAIINTLGGVYVDVPTTFYDPQLEGGLNAGYQLLDYDQAMLLCRARHAFDGIGDGDVYRAAHQRIVIKAVAKQILASDAVTMAQCVTGMAESVNTDMNVMDIVSIAQAMRGMDTENAIYSCMCPTSGLYTDGVWYEQVDMESWKAMMKRVDAGLPPYEDGATTTTLKYDESKTS